MSGGQLNKHNRRVLGHNCHFICNFLSESLLIQSKFSCLTQGTDGDGVLSSNLGDCRRLPGRGDTWTPTINDEL